LKAAVSDASLKHSSKLSLAMPQAFQCLSNRFMHLLRHTQCLRCSNPSRSCLNRRRFNRRRLNSLSLNTSLSKFQFSLKLLLQFHDANCVNSKLRVLPQLPLLPKTFTPLTPLHS
jgi:hypothetical protein